MRIARALPLLFVLVAAGERPAPAAADKPRVHVVATGGTIAGAQADPEQHGYKAGSFTVDSLIDAVPQLRDLATVTGEQVVNIGSQNMSDAVWLKLAKRLRELAAAGEADGFVVTHGTDTMEETAFFLDLVLPPGPPVVLTGSMRPATAISADGPMNLYNAVAVAGDPDARGCGVLVVANDEIHAAASVAKTDTAHVETFRSPDAGPVGTVDTGHARFLRPCTGVGRPAAPLASLDGVEALPRVDVVYAHSNMDGALIDAAVAAGAKGIVVAGVGNGNMTDAALDALSRARAKGVLVVRSTKLGSGLVIRNAEVDDDKLGFVASDELKPGKARALLQLALLGGADAGRAQELFYRY